MFTMRDIRLDGNTAGNTAGRGLCSASGVGGVPSGDMVIERVFIHSFEDEGIYWVDCWGSIIENSYIEYCNSTGAYLQGRNLLIDKTTFSFNHGYGLRFAGGGGSIPVPETISGCAFIENEMHGLYVTGADGLAVIGNIFQGNSVNNNDTYNAIHIAGGRNISIIGNNIHGNTSRDELPSIQVTHQGIRVDSQFNVTCIGNSITNTWGASIYIAVHGSTQCYGNIGFTTENWGTATQATGNTVTHGLSGTPDSVLVTMAVSEDCWVTAVGATTFTVNFDGGGSQTFYWHVKYIP